MVFIAAVTSCAPDAAPLQDEKSDDDADGDGLDVSGQCREQRAAVFAYDDGDGGGRAAGGEPVAPADDEAGVVAHGAAGEIELAAAAGDGGAEFGHGRGTDEGVESADDPDAEEKIDVGEPLRYVTGGADDAGGDRVAHGGGDAEPDA
jgi:hypothetical protein